MPHLHLPYMVQWLGLGGFLFSTYYSFHNLVPKLLYAVFGLWRMFNNNSTLTSEDWSPHWQNEDAQLFCSNCTSQGHSNRSATAALAAALFDPSLTVLFIDVHHIVTCVVLSCSRLNTVTVPCFLQLTRIIIVECTATCYYHNSEMALSKLSTARLPTSEIPEKPHQPLTLCFPKREFSKKQVVKQSFSHPCSSGRSYIGIHYDE